MSRYTGWRRLSGDASARPDLTDLGKKLLGHLAEQRKLSGISTMSGQVTAPDGSVVKARFLGDLPSIDIIAAKPPGGVQKRPTFPLLMVAILSSESPRRLLRALIEVDRYDAFSGKFVEPARKVLAWSDAGSGTPETMYGFAGPWQQPVTAAAIPEFIAFGFNNALTIYNPTLESGVLVVNSLWNSIYGVPIDIGTGRYQAPVYVPASGKIMSLGVAEYTPPGSLPQTLDASLVRIDRESLVAEAGVLLNELTGSGIVNPAEPGKPKSTKHITDFQASPTTGHVFIAYFSVNPLTGVSTAVVEKVSTDLAVVDSFAASDFSNHARVVVAPDGATLFLDARVRGGDTHTVLAIDADDMTAKQSMTFPMPPTWFNGTGMSMTFLGEGVIYVVTQDDDGACIEVRAQANLELVRKFSIAALEPVLSDAFLAGWTVGPRDQRIYIFPAAGHVVIINAKTGDLIESFDAADLEHDAPYPVGVILDRYVYVNQLDTTNRRNFFLSAPTKR